MKNLEQRLSWIVHCIVYFCYQKSFPKQVLRVKFTVLTRKLHGLGNNATA